jgi:hypothetical protein
VRRLDGGLRRQGGGAPYLYDFSYGYSDLYFYDIAPVHEAGEKFLMKVLHGDLAAIAMPESEKWGGSKVRKLMNRPLGAAAAAAGPTVDPLDELYGVASQPAYIKHYEADRTGKVLVNPYLQVATKEFPAILDAKMAPVQLRHRRRGAVTIIPEEATRSADLPERLLPSRGPVGEEARDA